MTTDAETLDTAEIPAISKSSLITQTYLLLICTLAFSSLCCYLGILQLNENNYVHQAWMPLILLEFVMIYLLGKLRDTVYALPLLFAFTGVSGYVLAPYVHNYIDVIDLALLATAAVVIGITVFVFITKARFNFMGNYLFTALIALIVVVVFNLLFQSNTLQLFIAYLTAIIFSGFLLYDTDQLIKEENQNPILMTTSLYIDVINLFVALVRIFAGGRN